MKKVLAGILTVAVLLTIGITCAFAAEPGAGRNYVDANGDGVCDYSHNRCQYIDADNNGVCDNYTARQARCRGNGHHCRRNR